MQKKRVKRNPPTGINLIQLRRYISKHYGDRCRKYLWGCPDCMAWRLYDDAKDFNDDANEINKIKKSLATT